MAVSEQRRHDLHQALEHVLGPVQAAALMEHLPPSGWADVATKADLDHLSALTKADLDHLGALTKRDIESLEVRMDAKIEGLGHRLEAILGRELGSMHQELGKVYKELAAHTRTTVFACIAAVMTSTGVALASARL